ncbi:unnamed protein product [Didymodactylos carnosus]|uniref:Syndecan n=1 Tax=Didymodactylos carnosus TaxID=1234261 RepID=A0A814VXN4_9BILA|nr:unnamed protein product [Didymodactylos carnosus]CAF1194675.1 unnamed protein product [Didymodactylos carnosus]CAF3697293.1 unnamed protein product [Didymodactylos carnosus]CAF3959085.1 unnamed protein product [Didymodactylos carnosus]
MHDPSSASSASGINGERNKTSTITSTTLLDRDVDSLNPESEDGDDFQLYDDNEEMIPLSTTLIPSKQNLSGDQQQQQKLSPTLKPKLSSVKYPSVLSSSQKSDQLSGEERFEDDDEASYEEYPDNSDDTRNSSSIQDAEDGKNDYPETSLNDDNNINNDIKPEQQNDNKFKDNMDMHTTIKLPFAQSSIWKGLFSKPGILAGLLSAVLMIMFIIYRMRKKDEGSYALEEERKSPSNAYTRVSSREFFA